MAQKSNRQRPFLTTKKHLARQEKEKRQTRLIITGTVLVLIVVTLIILVPLIIQGVIRPRQAVALVNDEKISTKEWQTQTKFYRYNVISGIENTIQYAQLFGNDPNFTASLTGQIQSQIAQLEPISAGNVMLNQMIDDELIQQEAEKRGIIVSSEEVESGVQEAFGYYEKGTPTPKPTFEPAPTSTLSNIQQTLVPASPTPTETVLEETPEFTETPEITPSATPTISTTATVTPTATPFTYDGYKKLYKERFNQISDVYTLSKSNLEDGLRYSITASLFRTKLIDDMFGEMSCSQNQVWARHILAIDETTALEIKNSLAEGADFCQLANDRSEDKSNASNCGDLGWFGAGEMVSEFEEVAFSLDVGEISDPVETEFGYHIIQV